MTKKQANPVVKFLQQNLVLIGIVILIISMLPMALETAARINARVKRMDTVCAHSMADSTKTTVNAGIYSASGTQIAALDVQGYAENGFTYYTGK